MSRRVTDQLTQTLEALIPTFTASRLPPPLLELATTLLLQSQTKASRLKPEEEPARSFAVCEIACQRLKTRLNLPKIESRPPCAPRTYKKLYQFLDRVLQVPVPVADDSPSRSRNIGRVVTPSEKALAAAAAVTPRSASARTGKSALTPLENAETEVAEDPATPTRKRKSADDARGFQQALPSHETPRMAAKAARVEQSPEPEFTDAVEHIDEPDDTFGAGADDEDEVSGPPAGPGRSAGLGSLMDNQRDWLTPERRAEYTRWEAKMLRRIEALERKQRVVPVQP